MAAVTAAVVGAVAALGTAAYSIKRGEEQKAEAKKQEKNAETERNRLFDEENKQKRLAEEEKAQQAGIAARNAASARNRALTGGGGGRAGTILTSPLGVQDPSSGGGKTLLGS